VLSEKRTRGRRGKGLAWDRTGPSPHQHNNPGLEERRWSEARLEGRQPWHAHANGAAAPSPMQLGPATRTPTSINAVEAVWGWVL
jgi:hypothetical protein